MGTFVLVSIDPKARGMFIHSGPAPCRAVCCFPVCAELCQISTLCVVWLSLSLSFVAACHVFGTSNLAKLSNIMCVFWDSLSLTRACLAAEVFFFYSIFFLLAAGSVCVLAVRRSVAPTAGRGDLCPLHSDPPTCQLHTWTLSSLRVHTHTRCLCSLIRDHDLSFVGVWVF